MQFISSLLLLGSAFFIQTTTAASYLTATALVTKNNASTFECWQLTEPFAIANAPGINGAQVSAISPVTDVGVVIIPPRFDGGIHLSPVPTLLHFLSGVAHVTLPEDPSSEALVVGGKGGLFFSVDTTGSGHITRYPSDQETVALMATITGGVIPKHKVLGKGACAGKQTFV
ncbi:hypothetical protein N0V90_007116 [Kalmusia sp. IMI 367209]|nr:hypothetical protein N0V90_007116 [Kalmusia sp. IMI 367209]